MARILYYKYSGSALPSDPTPEVPGDEYTEPLTFQNGYYKAIAKEENDWSDVTSASFGVAPDDCIHYYPLTSNFNDVCIPANNLSSSATITVDGAVISGSGQMMILESAISLTDFTLVFKITTTHSGSSRCIVATNDNNFGYAQINDFIMNSWANGSLSSIPNVELSSGVLHVVAITKSGSTIQWFIDGSTNQSYSAWDKPLGGFGGIIGFSGYECYGTYKDIMIFDRILTSEEIALLS